MIDFSLFELGDVVTQVLSNNRCGDCGSVLHILHVEREDNSWLVYTKCSKGCFERDEYNLFRIERTG
jgi:hypothetical protein